MTEKWEHPHKWLHDLSLSLKAANAVLEIGCRNHEDFMALNPDDVLTLHNVGRKSRNEITEKQLSLQPKTVEPQRAKRWGELCTIIARANAILQQEPKFLVTLVGDGYLITSQCDARSITGREKR